MKTFVLIIILILGFINLRLFGQDTPNLPYPDSQIVITALGECDRFFYIGTTHGLVRLSKSNGKTCTLKKSNSSLPSNHITSIACTRDGQAYIGTTNGILMWDRSAFLPITRENSNLPDYYITALAVDNAGNLWVGTYRGGLLKCTGDPVRPFKVHQIATNEESIYSISIDPNGKIWVGFYSGGFAYLRNGEWEEFPPGQVMEKVNPDISGRFLFNVYEQGAFLLNGSAFKNINIDFSPYMLSCTYFSLKYSKLFLCDDTNVYNFNIQDPALLPNKITYSNFIKELVAMHPKKKSKNKDDHGDSGSDTITLNSANKLCNWNLPRVPNFSYSTQIW